VNPWPDLLQLLALRTRHYIAFAMYLVSWVLLLDPDETYSKNISALPSLLYALGPRMTPLSFSLPPHSLPIIGILHKPEKSWHGLVRHPSELTTLMITLE